MPITFAETDNVWKNTNSTENFKNPNISTNTMRLK
jgi:hypothetical protein